MLRDILLQKGFSNRQCEVTELITKGLTNLEVSDQLFITEKTVCFHLRKIKTLLNLESRAQIIVWCLPHMAPTTSYPVTTSYNNETQSNIIQLFK